mmetsp:Transcript_133432/g.285328  ORF Transcript_133432/g.285328 Transcript_133432/m.285328 type:complete len:938 (-) Transcript_133432:57-2870(-)
MVATRAEDGHESKDGKDSGLETRKVTKEEAAFILGQGGKTKQKLCIVSGAQIELTENKNDRMNGSSLQIRGTAEQREHARKYVEFVIAQRRGPVNIDDPSAHNDLTILVVPADCVSFITGRQGSFLRLIEEEWGALLFFLEVNPKNPPTYVDPTKTERLAIFGPFRRRRGAQVKVMAAIEMKVPGYFSNGVTVSESSEEGFATDTMVIKEEDYSYALGRSGATRKKLSRASNCIVEYVGRVAYFCGNKKERARAKEYLTWLLQQRVGEQVNVLHKGRDDATMVLVPNQCMAFVTGYKGQALRSIEEETSTFCFVDQGSVDAADFQVPLSIFGRDDDRRSAEGLIWERIAQKIDDPVTESSYGHGGGKRGGKSKGGKGEGKGKGKGKGKERDTENWQSTREEGPEVRPVRKEGDNDFMTITTEDVSFLTGASRKMLKKIAAASGTFLEMQHQKLEIVGAKDDREKAKKYVQLVLAQRVRAVTMEDVAGHEDLTIIEVPAVAVSFVTGRQGSFLRLVEEEFGTMLFFFDYNKANQRDQVEKLAIFGPLRERRGAELKVLSAIETKQPGFIAKLDGASPMQDPAEGFATDRMLIEEDDYSYALGRGGATRKKIARAAGCVIEYIGRYAYLCGVKKERVRAREYLVWLFQQRVGSVEVDYANRDDVTVLQVPRDCVGFVTGAKGASLRSIEDATGTFCFIEGGRDDPNRDPKPLLIFGSPKARLAAEERLKGRIDQKLVEGWVFEEGGGSGGGGYGGAGGYGEWHGQSWEGGRRHARGGWGASTATEDNGTGVGGAGEAAVEEAAAEEEPEAWGDWGGNSGDEDEPEDSAAYAGPSVPAAASTATPATSAAAPVAGAGAASAAPAAAKPATQRPGMHLLGAAGNWNPHAGSLASPQRSGGGSAAKPSPNRGGEELDLPPQLLHEEAWPELGGPPKKKGGRP